MNWTLQATRAGFAAGVLAALVAVFLLWGFAWFLLVAGVFTAAVSVALHDNDNLGEEDTAGG